MSIDRFIEERQNSWSKLSFFIDKIEREGLRGLTKEELDELGQVYRKVTSDLAHAQTYFKGSELAEYLNRLVSKAHNQIYTSKALELRKIIDFFIYEFPQTFRKTIKYTTFAALVFICAGIFGYVLFRLNPEASKAFLPKQLDIGPLEESLKEGVLDEYRIKGPPGFAFLLSGFIMRNNIKVGLAAFALGIGYGVCTFFMLFYNGVLLGELSSLFDKYGYTTKFWAFILPHGVIELMAVFICGGAGFIMGYALINPGDYTRKQSLMLAAQVAVKLVGGVVPLFVFAALIEEFVTPLPIGDMVKLGFAGAAGIMLFFYLFPPVKKTLARHR